MLEGDVRRGFPLFGVFDNRRNFGGAGQRFAPWTWLRFPSLIPDFRLVDARRLLQRCFFKIGDGIHIFEPAVQRKRLFP